MFTPSDREDSCGVQRTGVGFRLGSLHPWGESKEMPACHHLCFAPGGISGTPHPSWATIICHHPPRLLELVSPPEKRRFCGSWVGQSRLIPEYQHGSSSLGVHLHGQNTKQLKKTPDGCNTSFNLVIFQHLPGWNGRQRLMEAVEGQPGGHCDSRSLSDDNPALCLQCWPNSAILQDYQRRRTRWCSSVKTHSEECCQPATLATE